MGSFHGVPDVQTQNVYSSPGRKQVTARACILGWMNYYGISQYYRPLQNLDDWLRRRIRMCYWKQWRHPRTKVRKLMELGIPKDFAVIAGSSSKAYWHLSKCYATNAGMSNDWLEKQGLVNIKDLWCKAQGYK